MEQSVVAKLDSPKKTKGKKWWRNQLRKRDLVLFYDKNQEGPIVAQVIGFLSIPRILIQFINSKGQQDKYWSPIRLLRTMDNKEFVKPPSTETESVAKCDSVAKCSSLNVNKS